MTIDIHATDLNMTTAERLLMVASIIELDPEHHDQQFWAIKPNKAFGYDSLATLEVEEIAGLGYDQAMGCNTVCCVAGWAVAMSPRSEVADGIDDFADLDDRLLYGIWEYLGERALGLEHSTANKVFYWANKREPLIRALRFLATLPEGDRTVGALVAGGFTFHELLGE